MLAAVAAIPIYAALAEPARAAETVYPYCATPTWSEGLDCDYQSFQQCLSVNAGFSRTCVPNPSFAAPQAQLPPSARRRAR